MITIRKNFYPFTSEGEKNYLPSETIPDMTMSIPEMIQRYQRGIPIPMRTPQYDEEYIPDIHTMDLVDRENYINAFADELQEEHALLLEKQKQEQADREKHRIIEEYKRLQESEPTNDDTI